MRITKSYHLRMMKVEQEKSRRLEEQAIKNLNYRRGYIRKLEEKIRSLDSQVAGVKRKLFSRNEWIAAEVSGEH